MKTTLRTKKLTRIASIILTLATLLSVICIATAATGAASKRVSLYSAGVTFSKYGGSSYEVYIQTKDNARNQEVYVHYNYLDSMKWQDAKADYYTTLDDGSKIWRAVFSSFNTKYAIKYIADGKTYWDNNNYNDYDGTERIGTAPITADRLGYQYTQFGGDYRIDAILQNYAYHKSVFVRYTTDGWRSYRDQYLNYNETLKDGTERWTTYIPIHTEIKDGDFEYAICYRVNGREYWANNFRNNYDFMHCIHH